MGEEHSTKKLCMDFLICCYFGQSNNLIKAAIDRAYRDMAVHTMHDLKEGKDKWKYRFNASLSIADSITGYNSKKYDNWHKETITKLKECYLPDKLTEGKAQKWLNMTVKYLYMFKNLIDEDDYRLKDLKAFYNNTSVTDYKIPIDSFVIKEAEGKWPAWSKLNDDLYPQVENALKEKNNFLWELKNWESLVSLNKKYDDGSYEMNYRKNRERFINKKEGDRINAYLKIVNN